MHDAQGSWHNAGHVTDAVVDAIAAEADSDRRSVIRRLAGLPVRGRAGRRIDAVLARINARGAATYAV